MIISVKNKGILETKRAGNSVGAGLPNMFGNLRWLTYLPPSPIVEVKELSDRDTIQCYHHGHYMIVSTKTPGSQFLHNGLNEISIANVFL